MLCFKFLLLSLFVILSSLTYSKQIYVSTNGDDNNTGGLNAPFLTIQKAVDVAQAGDSVIIRGGLYRIKKALKISCRGNSSQWITIKSFPGEIATIDAKTFTEVKPSGEPPSRFRLGAVQIENSSYLRFENITVINSTCAGIMIKGPGTSNIQIYHCHVDRTYSSGIGVWYADSVEVKHCEITRANDKSMKAPKQPERRETPHEALTLAGAVNFDIAYNHIHLCYKEGIDCKEVSKHGIIHHNHIHDLERQGLYVDSWFGELADVELFENIVYECEWGFAISAEGKKSNMKQVFFHHNILFNNRGSGILFGVWGHDEERKDIYIYNNTIYNNGTYGHWAGLTGGIDIRSDNLKDVYIFNNIAFGNRNFDIASFQNPEDGYKSFKKQNIIIHNNLIGGIKPQTQEEGAFFKPVYALPHNYSAIADPLFTDADNHDFSLSKNSPAKDTGITKYREDASKYTGAVKPVRDTR